MRMDLPGCGSATWIQTIGERFPGEEEVVLVEDWQYACIPESMGA
jgi:hypothetical protein